LLAQTEKNRGAQGAGSNQHQVRSHESTTPILSDMGITKDQSSRYQQLAAMPDDHFETAVAIGYALVGRWENPVWPIFGWVIGKAGVPTCGRELGVHPSMHHPPRSIHCMGFRA